MTEETITGTDGHTDEAEQAGSERHAAQMASLLSPKRLISMVALHRESGSPEECDDALNLLAAFGAARGGPDLVVLLDELRAAGSRGDADVVLEGAALYRSARQAAEIVMFLPENGQDTDAMTDLIARYRSPRDVARCARVWFVEGRPDLARNVVSGVAEHRPIGVVARLDLALRALGVADLALTLIRVVLRLRSSAADINELIDCQIEFGSRLGDGDDPVADHVRDEMDIARVAEFIMGERGHEPGRAMAWCASVAESDRRRIDSVVALHEALAQAGATELVEKITSTVATTRGDDDLVDYAMRCADRGVVVTDALFREVSEYRDGSTVGEVILLWDSKGGGTGSDVCGLFAEYAPAGTLLTAEQHLAARRGGDLAVRLLRAALDTPQRFAAPDVARLLFALNRRTPRRRVWRNERAHTVVRALDALFDEHPDALIGVAYFAALACHADDLAHDSDGAFAPNLAAKICDDLGDAIANRRKRALSLAYADALLAGKKPVLSAAFRRRLEP